jgi:glutamate N-acetyltransferase / amino-acid N-acetyltransferase
MNQAAGSEQVHLPEGFSFSSLVAGIKASGRADLTLVTCREGTRAAAVFTSNRVVAAPVTVGRSALKASGGSIRALIVNSGNANCATGPAGLAACRSISRRLARCLSVKEEEIFPSSTGIIGVPLPSEKIIAKIPILIAQQESTVAAARRFAHAIMTTDTRAKMASASFRTRSGTASILGIAKGSGMIHPQLATMLVYLFTDVGASPSQLRRVLVDVCRETFNCISVDGDTSTNDTVLLMASGQSAIRLREARIAGAFRDALFKVCESLAFQIVSDGEGVQHVVRLTVEQSRSRAEALQVAKAIAHSALVKTAWAGADPNWGRILAAAGNSGIALDPGRVNIFIGDQAVCRGGTARSFDAARAHRHLQQRECEVRVQLGRGRRSVRFYTTDLSAEYVRINADYST